jgi:hypothetical protein
MAGKRPPMGAGKGKGKGKLLVPPAKGAPKGKPLVRAKKGVVDAEAPPGPPPRPMRGRIAIAMPVAEVAPARGRMGPPPPGRSAPPRLTPPAPPAAELEERPSSRAPVMQQRGAPAAMARLRRGQVTF